MLPSALSSCFSTAASFPTLSALPSASRQPDAVAIDLPASYPPVQDSARAQTGAVPLREPSDPQNALKTVRAFFRAIAKEDSPGLRKVLSPDATVSALNGSSPVPAERQWDQRLHKLDYSLLGPEPVYRESAIELYRYRDFPQLPPGRPTRPAWMLPSDVMVRVPIANNRLGPDRYFGDELVFVLRASPSGYLIQTMLEDFQLP